ncbi:MAG: transposase domain-containing protein [Pseudomonadales bacterium]|nr:transposase domain-containing protein [Pseudomonadales bacterium]
MLAPPKSAGFGAHESRISSFFPAKRCFAARGNPSSGRRKKSEKNSTQPSQAPSTGPVKNATSPPRQIATMCGPGVDPQRYLTSVLAKIGTTPAEELEQFLPDV